MAAKPKADSGAMRSWHPDFRDAAQLPDIRVVRTGTFMMIVGLALLAGGAIYVAQQEVTIHTRNSEVTSLKEKTEGAAKTLAARVALSKDFEAKAAKVEALAAHGAGKPLGSELMLLFANLRPDTVRYLSVQIRPQDTVIRVVAEGQDLDALLLVPGNLARVVRESPEVMKYFKQVLPPSFEPPKEGRLEFDLILRR